MCKQPSHVSKDCDKFVFKLNKEKIFKRARKNKYHVGKEICIDYNKKVRPYRRNLQEYNIKNIRGSRFSTYIAFGTLDEIPEEKLNSP